ncbi:MAG: NAD(+)/NADH kinase [Cellulosilyticaceae bacterium]
MRKIGVMPNLLKDVDLTTTKRVVSWLQDKGFYVYVTAHIASKLDLTSSWTEQEIYSGCEAIIAIGGDGTILDVAQKSFSYNIPILGINLGRLGFLADVETSDVEVLLEKLLDSPIKIEERMMLRARVVEPTGQEHYFYALNDINITRGSGSRITEFEIRVNEHLLDVYPADGIIIATPTGSTAYNLSAGGPIVIPYADNIIITPVCPHTIYSRAMIVAGEDKINLRTYNYDNPQMELTADGQTKMNITPAHIIEIDKSPYKAKLIKLSELNFFDILRKKIVERRI